MSNWHHLFEYDAINGLLIWKPRPLSVFRRAQDCARRNNRYAGKIAGSEHYSDGRRHAVTVWVLETKRSVGVHRIVWEMHHGPIPKGLVIDHIDGNPFNNRLANLRLATTAENARNSRFQSNNTSGYKGVTFHKASGLWKAQLKYNRTPVVFGYFQTREEAYAAYQKGAIQYHGEFARTA